MSVYPPYFGSKSPPKVQLACAAEQRMQCKHQQTRQHTTIMRAKNAAWPSWNGNLTWKVHFFWARSDATVFTRKTRQSTQRAGRVSPQWRGKSEKTTLCNDPRGRGLELRSATRSLISARKTCTALQHFEIKFMQSKWATRTFVEWLWGEWRNRVNVFSMAKVGRHGGGCHKDCWMKTRDRHYPMALRAVSSAFTWINDICRQTPTYSSASPQQNLALRCSLRSCFVADVDRSRKLKLQALVQTAHKVDLDTQANPSTWNVLRDEGEVPLLWLQSPVSHTWLYMKPHIRLKV